MTRTRVRVSDAAATVRPYVERAMTDAELRENVRAAFAAAREVYDELIANRSMTRVANRMATDREIQDKLREAVDELRQAANRVQGRREHPGRNAALLIMGIAIGILLNPVTGPATRKWLADAVFGPDDFTYESPGADGSGGDNSAAA
jgi:hypothetical protein